MTPKCERKYKQKTTRLTYSILSVWLICCLGLIYIVFNMEKGNDTELNDLIDCLRGSTVLISVVLLFRICYDIINKKFELKEFVQYFYALSILFFLQRVVDTSSLIYILIVLVLLYVYLKLPKLL